MARRNIDGHYNISNLNLAAKDIKEGHTWRQVESHHAVPKSVLRRFMERGADVLGKGRRTVLGLADENELEQCLIARSMMGFPCDKKELLQLVMEYVTFKGIASPFKSNRPGEKWYRAFMSRHPKLSLKKPEQMQRVRILARDPFVIFAFYDAVEQLYKECAIGPHSAPLIFNTDESGFCTDPTKVKGIGEKGQTLSRVVQGSGREHHTVLACVSASGCVLPPLIVFKGLSVQQTWISSDEYPGTMYSATSNGWMEEPTFFMWMSKMFVPHVHATRATHDLANHPAILFFDGHASHISIRIVQLALAHNIRLVKFPSHLTDKIQPLDVSVFSPIKRIWDEELVEHGKRQMGSGSVKLQKQQFAAFLSNTWNKINQTTILNGFARTGLFPFNREVVKDNWFCPVTLERYRRHVTAKKSTYPASVLSETAPDPVIEMEEYSCREGPSSLDEPMDLSLPKKPELESEPKPNAMTIVKIFAEKIAANKATTPIVGTTPRRRLKHHSMGEILTSQEVIVRLEEAEEKKRGKKRGSDPKPSTSGVKKTKK